MINKYSDSRTQSSYSPLCDSYSYHCYHSKVITIIKDIVITTFTIIYYYFTNNQFCPRNLLFLLRMHGFEDRHDPVLKVAT